MSAQTFIGTREKLLDTVERLMCEQGFAGISTRDIARESELAEGTLYNHFRDKEEIFIAVIQRNVAGFRDTLQDLPLRVGQCTVRENLEEVANAASKFYSRTAPLLCSLFADLPMLESVRKNLNALRMGPERSFEVLALYISAEQRIGRVAQAADAIAAAAVLLNSAFGFAVLDCFLARRPTGAERRRRIFAVIDTIVGGLAPRAET